MILYHITPRQHLESILEKGIIPAYRKGLTLWNRQKHKKVFLTNDVDKILFEQAGERWIKNKNPIIFEVEIDEKDFKPHEYHFAGETTFVYSDFEFVTDKIEPNKIKKYYPVNINEE